MTTQFRTKIVSDFVCTTDKCPDTCCKHWSMQMDRVTFEKYKSDAPELLDAVEEDNDKTLITKKDPQSGYCVKFSDGKCGIHLKYGEGFLGDACYFYPRITRDVGEARIITATMSCPEIAKIALYSENPFVLEEVSSARAPQEIKNVLPEGLSVEDALSIHKLFIAATEDKEASAEKIFARISSVSRSLARIEKKGWLGATGMYFRLADSAIPAPEKNINDPFNLLHSLCGLVVASKKSIPPRLKQTISEMENALSVKLDWQNVLINASEESVAAYDKLQKLWQNEMRDEYNPLLKRWLAAQISASFYPFAGLGGSLPERITIIGVRLAILKLALMSIYSINDGKLHQDDVIRVVQSLSRFLEHLADPSFSLRIYEETGWNKENRLLGLIG